MGRRRVALNFPIGFSAAADDPRHAAARVAAVSTFSTVAGLMVPQAVGRLAEWVPLRHAMLLVVIGSIASFVLARSVRGENRIFRSRRADAAEVGSAVLGHEAARSPWGSRGRDRRGGRRHSRCTRRTRRRVARGRRRYAGRMTRLADLTTLRVGGPARELVEPTTDADMIAAVRDADAAGVPVLVIGGGSNLLVGDEGFDGVVIRDARRDIERDVTIQDDGFCGGVSVTVAAGVPWDDVVARAVRDEWVGLEALSGIPGSTGATPVQNVGAYGSEVAETIASVRTWDRLESRVRTLPAIDCGFGYRDSLFKRSQRGAASDGAVGDDSVGAHPAIRGDRRDVPDALWHPLGAGEVRAAG